MFLPSSSELRARAADALTHAPGHRRLVLISAGLSTLLALLVSGLNMLLDSGIATTGGLAGLGMRSILTTAQSLLTLATSVALPFWMLGYTSVSLKLAKGEPARKQDLLNGFRYFFPALRLLLMLEVLFIGLFIACIYLGSMLLSMTPLGFGLYQTVLPVLMAGGDPASLDPEALMQAMAPVFIGCAVIYGVVAILLYYRLRMAQLALMDDPKAGAGKALMTSIRMTKGNCKALFRLDLSFWWFYVLEALLAVIAYGDLLLPYLGIEMNATAAYFVFYVLSLGLQLLLYYRVKNPISVTYAHAYLSLRSDS